MNRRVTYLLRTVLDECLPAFIRDNRFFMYPCFFLWFKGQNIRRIMEFKSYFHTMSEEEFAQLYCTIATMSRDRLTDLNEPSVLYILSQLDRDAGTLLDVGCGNGYFLKRAEAKGYTVHGCDLRERPPYDGCAYTQGNAEALKFPDKSFDIVTCNHTIEHVRDLKSTLAELKRIARKQVVITTPCQRYFYYTLDLHIHFFPVQSYLEDAIRIPQHTCKKLWGDWVYVGRVSS